MSIKIIRSIIPIAPQQYESSYVNQLARALDKKPTFKYTRHAKRKCG